MELIITEKEQSNKTVLQIKEYCKLNEIPVTTKLLNDPKSVKNLEIDDGPGKPWIVIVMDNTLAELMEGCGRIVARLIKLTSKPNKIIYYALIEEDEMEMFDANSSHIVRTLEELKDIINKKTPAEYDEISNTCATLQSLNLGPLDSLSNNSLEEEHNQKSMDLDKDRTCPPEQNQQPENRNGNQGILPSVATNNLYPTLPTSLVSACVSCNSPRALHQLSIPGNSYDSSGPPAMPCQSAIAYNSMPYMQHSSSYPPCNTLHPDSITGSETGKPMTMNNFNYRREILDLNQNFSPTFNPNIRTDGSDNRLPCDRYGNSMIPKKNQTKQSYIGPSSASLSSASGASGIAEKEYMSMNQDSRVIIWDLKEDVMEMIRDSLDCAETYNWKKLADIHKWSCGDIYQLEQKWKSRKIESPFMHLIEGFQHYTLYDLKEDLHRIPRKDLLHKLCNLQHRGLLFHS